MIIFFDIFGTFGGAQQSTLTLIRSLRKRLGEGEIECFCVKGTHKKFLTGVEDVKKVFSPPFSHALFNVSRNKLKALISSIALIFMIIVDLKRFSGRSDHPVVVVSSVKSIFLFLIPKLIYSDNVRLVFYCRGDGKPKVFGRLARIVLNSSHVQAIACVSSETKRNLSEFIRDPEKLKITYTSVDFDRLSELDGGKRSESYSPRRILYAGAIIPAKGVDLLLQAVSALPYETEVWIAGDFNNSLREGYYSKCQKICQEHGLNVLWLGWSDNIPRLINQVDIVCLPSLSEGMPRIVQEGLYLRRIVVATDVGGVSDLIINGSTGFLAKPGSISDLTEKLDCAVKLTLSKEENKIKDAAREHLISKFSLENQVSLFLRAIRE